MRRINKTIFCLFALLLATIELFGQQEFFRGTVKGKVIDFKTKQPMIGVNIYIPELGTEGERQTKTASTSFQKLTLAATLLFFPMLDMKKNTTTDVIVRTERITYVNVEMKPVSINMKDVEVTARYFNSTETQNLSAVSFSFEEIRRTPGAGGDVSRIIFGLPSLLKN